MKKIMILVIVLQLILGCSKTNTDQETNSKLVVPELVGMNIYEDYQILLDLDLKISIIYEVKYEIEDGEVLFTEPKAGTIVDKDSQIEICLNKIEKFKQSETTETLKSILIQNYQEEESFALFERIIDRSGHSTFSSDSSFLALSSDFDVRNLLVENNFIDSYWRLNVIAYRLTPVEEQVMDFRYLSKNEEKIWTENYKQYFCSFDFEDEESEENECIVELFHDVYKLSDYQSFVDDVWGIGRVNMDNLESLEDLYLIISETGYVYIGGGFGGPYSDGMYKIIEIERIFGDSFIVRGKFLEVFNKTYEKEPYQLRDYYDDKMYTSKKKNTVSYEETYKISYDDFISKNGFSDEFGIIEIEVYPTKDGLKIWGRRNHGNKKIPEIYCYEEVVVKASGGLNLREGPGTNYKRIITIPNNSRVTIIGKREDITDWVCVFYYGKNKFGFTNVYSGWVDAKYLEK